MKAIEEVYPKDGEGHHHYYDYKPMLDSFGYETVLQVDDNDYQGDSRVLFMDGDRYGLLIFGWGSCSGCDALSACQTIKEVGELRDELHNDIIWKSSRQEMLDFIKERDWEAQYSWHAEETREFVAKAIAFLEAIELTVHTTPGSTWRRSVGMLLRPGRTGRPET